MQPARMYIATCTATRDTVLAVGSIMKADGRNTHPGGESEVQFLSHQEEDG